MIIYKLYNNNNNNNKNNKNKEFYYEPLPVDHYHKSKEKVYCVIIVLLPAYTTLIDFETKFS